MRPTVVLRALALVALLAFPVSRAGAELDQSQDLSDNIHAISFGATAWQTFTPSIGGALLGVDVLLSTFCMMPACDPASDLTVEIVVVSGGVPLPTVIGSANVSGASAPTSQEFVSVDFSTLGIALTAGQQYAIHLASSGAGGPMNTVWFWGFDEGGNPYADGEFFSDGDNGDGLDDPSTAAFPSSDAAFRTHMDPGVCGDGAPNAGEDCDDGNTVGGDGCTAFCFIESCGDAIVNDSTETCDDGNTVDGDGCTAACSLEKSALACQTAIVKGGQKYATARLAALAKCRLAFAAGKPLSITNPRECASETAAAKSIDKAAGALRRALANGNKPKCTDLLVAALGACADAVDGLVTPDTSGGCLLSAHDAAVEAMIESQLGE